MDEYERLIRHTLQRTATIHIYSFPPFMLETFTTFTIFLIYLVLHSDLTTINRRMGRLRPDAVYIGDRTESGSNGSICTSISQYREIYKVKTRPSRNTAHRPAAPNISANSQWGWVMPNQPVNKTTLDNVCYGEQLVALTPEQFVKIDIERKQREKELDSYMTSLSTLCKNVLNKKYSEKTLTRQVDMARESLQCNKMSLEGKYLGFRTDAMTTSLFSMLEQMITSSSLQNPLPFKGDITTLALDAADLSIDSSNVANWDTFSSTIISEGSDIITTFKEGKWEKDENVEVNWKKIQ